MVRKFMKYAAPLTAAALAIGLAGCSVSSYSTVNGVPLAELDQSGAAPTELALASGDTVIITQGGSLAITVDGDPDDVAEMRFALEGDALGIARQSEGWSGGGVTVNVTMPAQTELSMAGSGKITTQSLANTTEISIAGSGDITASDIAADKLEISIKGSGSFSGKGKADSLAVSLAGSGSAKMAELQVDIAEVSIAGSGSASFASDGTVSASIMGSGNVNVTGTATCTESSMGSGSLNCSPGT